MQFRSPIIWLWPMTTLDRQSVLVGLLLPSLLEQHEQEYNTMTDKDEFTDLPDLVPISDANDVEEEEEYEIVD